jgi:hypothetical protein
MSRYCAECAVGWNHDQGRKRIGHVPAHGERADHVNRFTKRMTVMYHDGFRLDLAHVLLHQWLRAGGLGR